MNKSGKKTLSGNYIFLLIISLLIVVVVYGGYWVALDKYLPESGRGQFGDKFGGVNALFTGLAFAVLIVTMRLQSKELHAQFQELKDTRETFERTQFENTFFKLVQLHIDTINRLYDYGQGSESKGRSYFTKFYHSINNQAIQKTSTNSFQPGKETSDKVVYCYNYDNFYIEIMSIYFESVKNLIEFVLNADDKLIANKAFYLRTFDAQLSRDEKAVLFYHAAWYTDAMFSKIYKLSELSKLLTDRTLFRKEDLDLIKAL